MSDCKHEDFELYYVYEIYQNPNTQKSFLLLWGVGSYCPDCKKFFKFNKDIWVYNKYGYRRLKTYSDYVGKYGKLPCVVVTHEKEPIDIEETYKNESTLRKRLKIKAAGKYASNSKMNMASDANEAI